MDFLGSLGASMEAVLKHLHGWPIPWFFAFIFGVTGWESNDNLRATRLALLVQPHTG